MKIFRILKKIVIGLDNSIFFRIKLQKLFFEAKLAPRSGIKNKQTAFALALMANPYYAFMTVNCFNESFITQPDLFRVGCASINSVYLISGLLNQC